MNDLSTNTSVLVCVTAHYSEPRLKWLREALAPYARFPCPVRVVMNTNDIGTVECAQLRASGPAGLDISVRVHRGLTDPFALAWCHKEIIAKEFLSGHHTHFIYIEDDIVIEPEAFLYWVRLRQPLRRYRLIPGFVRIERSDDNAIWFATDQFRTTKVDWLRVRSAGGMAFTNLDSSYAACHILDRELADEHVDCPSFSEASSSLIKPNWETRERAAMGITFSNVPRFFLSRSVIPFDRRTFLVPKFACVVHAPGNYAADRRTDLAKLPLERVLEPTGAGDFLWQRGQTIKKLLTFSGKEKR